MTAVIHIVTALERGGAQRNTLETAARLHDPGRPQYVITGRAAALDDEARARLGKRLLHVEEMQNPIRAVTDARVALTLAREIERIRGRHGGPVVVHTHSSKAGILGRLAARAVGAVAMHTVHGFGLEAMGPRRRWLAEAAERVASPACDVVVYVSEADRRLAGELGLFRGARACVIRSGIDPAPFRGVRERRATARASLMLPEGARVAVTIGNLKPQKDPLRHVDILHAWRKRDPDAHLVFLGDGELRDATLDRVKTLGLNDAFHLLGFVSDTREALAAADVFLLASAWEGLPRAVLEATAAGLPCVVRDTGYAADLAWARSVRALPLAAPMDEFAVALERAATSKVRASKLPREFTLAGMLEDLERVYDDLIGAPRPVDVKRPRRRRTRSTQAS